MWFKTIFGGDVITQTTNVLICVRQHPVGVIFVPLKLCDWEHVYIPVDNLHVFHRENPPQILSEILTVIIWLFAIECMYLK